MIHFEIIQSPDLNVKTSFQYHKNEVYIGSESADLSIADPGLLSSHLMIEIPEKELLVHPQKEVSFYLINGKRTTSIRKIKAGDTITIGNTVIKIIAFALTERPSKKEILNQKLATLIEKGSHRLPVIERVTKLMK
ncbi:MAG TPA: FHA domain-containing protein [Bacteriovoracaceae bacterium]|nr:FHA domain-containing protein [Bacteriovoracaceae bacterium]